MLGIAKLWQVTGVQVSLADDEVEVTVGMDAGAHFIQQLRLGRLARGGISWCVLGCITTFGMTSGPCVVLIFPLLGTDKV